MKGIKSKGMLWTRFEISEDVINLFVNDLHVAQQGERI
jgi:hypothetical protein